MEDLTIQTLAELINKPLKLSKNRGSCFSCENSNAFRVSSTGHSYRCYACGIQGGFKEFLVETQACANLEEARKYLGTIGKKQTYQPPPSYLQSYYKQSLSYVKPQHHQYLLDRGISTEILKDYPIGYGAVKSSQSELSMLHERLIFPIRNQYGHLIHMQGRSLDPNAKLRWLSTKGDIRISDCLFNIEKVVKWREEFGYVFLCEGLTDCYSLLSLGLPACATFGIWFSLDKLAYLLNDLMIVAIYDNDRYALNGNRQLADKYKSWLGVIPSLIHFYKKTKNTDIYCVMPPRTSGVGDVNEMCDYFDWSSEDVLDYVEDNMVSLEQMALEFKGLDPTLLMQCLAVKKKPEDMKKLHAKMVEDSAWFNELLEAI